MLNPDLELLPLGTSSFAALRDFGQIYVDKTDLIARLAKRRGKFFLARPRRFGKSLLISTFEALFSTGKKYFEGLDLYHIWNEKTFNVVRLDFSEIRNVENVDDFERNLVELLFDKFSAAGFSLESDYENLSFYRQLSRWLNRQPINSLVILIDEYDAPLTDTLDNKALFSAVRRVLSSFYSILKANDSAIRFLFITGITKFQKTSIFSELNNLQDLSLDKEFAALLGYTQEEINRYFSPYIEACATTLNIPLEELRAKLAEHYDGYCFELAGDTHVFTPWSVLNFFARPEQGFANYWYESGGKPQMLLKYFQSHALRDPQQFNQAQALRLSELSGSSDFDQINDIALLTQAGYLTIKRKESSTVFLGYPNLEVELSMANLYMEQLLKKKTLPEIGAGGLFKMLAAGNVDRVVELFNKIFRAIPYEDYRSINEGFVRSVMYVALMSEGTEVRAEVHNAHGRSDLEMLAENCRWVMEIKLAREGDSAEALLEAGLKQMRNRHYGEASHEATIKRVVIVFSASERQISAWKIC